MWEMTDERRQKFAEDVLFRFHQGHIGRWTAFNYLTEAGYDIKKAKRMLDKTQKIPIKFLKNVSHPTEETQ